MGELILEGRGIAASGGGHAAARRGAVPGASAAASRAAAPGAGALRAAAWGVALLVVFALCGCGKVDIEWREEVRLASGQKILVKRTAEGKRLGEIGGTGGWRATKMTVEIVEPRLPTNPPVWSEPWVPMLFDYDPEINAWFVVATFYMCEDWYGLGRPKLPYVQFRTGEGKWERVDLDPRYIGRAANLLTGPSAKGEPKLIDLETKRRREITAGKSFKRVLDSWSSSC